MGELAPLNAVENRIFQIRGKKVLLDKDLAELYGVETKYLTRQVRRNAERFPCDFMLILTYQELRNLRCQIGASSYGGRRYLPYAFTEQGVAMLSGVLNSKQAVAVNIRIMRAFVNLRRVAVTYAGLKNKIEIMEKKYDKQFGVVFKAIWQLMEPSLAKSRVITGFKPV
ncbi:MAG: ORF6N domain-containing protein [Candidatus Omnitrophota bacterium]